MYNPLWNETQDKEARYREEQERIRIAREREERDAQKRATEAETLRKRIEREHAVAAKKKVDELQIKMNKAAAEKRAKIDEDHKKRIAEHALRMKAAKEQAAQNKEAKKKGYVNVPF